MLLVVCPNLAIDRILVVDHFEQSKVQRSRSVCIQPGGKGSNVARVYRQLGGEVVLVGFVGRRDGDSITEPLRRMGVHVDAVTGYEAESRTCTIVCDPQAGTQPTVIKEGSAEIEPGSAEQLLAKNRKSIRRVDGALTTGRLSNGLADELYA